MLIEKEPLFDVQEGWFKLARRLRSLDRSKKFNEIYQDWIMEIVDRREACDIYNDEWPGYALINLALNEAIRNPYLLREHYSSLCYFAGMWGFRFSIHFKLL